MKRKTKGLLVRVGVDSGEAGGCWNAPADSRNRSFCYVPINRPESFRPGMETFYRDKRLGFVSALRKFGCQLPAHLLRSRTHLDPDYRYLTYGDVGKRAAQIRKLSRGDFLVFYSAFVDVSGKSRELIYAITGILVIAELKNAREIPPESRHWNAHTRVNFKRGSNDVVVFGKSKVSGRFEKFIPIGCLRKALNRRGKRRSYYVRESLLRGWGEPAGDDCYIQRSRTLPSFSNSHRFLRWLKRQRIRLLKRNN